PTGRQSAPRTSPAGGLTCMRLLHFGDLHLGVENYGTIDTTTGTASQSEHCGTIDPTPGMSTRIADCLHSLDAIVDRAIAESVDAVLFAGDAFKNRDPHPTR